MAEPSEAAVVVVVVEEAGIGTTETKTAAMTEHLVTARGRGPETVTADTRSWTGAGSAQGIKDKGRGQTCSLPNIFTRNTPHCNTPEYSPHCNTQELNALFKAFICLLNVNC
jgi:hypothetical protein